jgi:hypothetical protein
MKNPESIERKLKRALTPIYPRKEFAWALKDKIISGTRMSVELEHDKGTAEVITLTAVGLGAIASVVVVATIGVKVAGLLGSGAVLLHATRKPQTGSQKAKPHFVT